jgi:TolB protein
MHGTLDSYKSQIWIMNADGTGQRQLTRGGNEYFNPVFTPDGRKLACERADGIVCLVDMTGGKIVEIGHGNLTPISTRSKKVYYTEPEEDADSHIMVVNQDGTGRESLGQGRSPSVSPDGKLIVFLDEPDNQPLWVMKSDGSDRRNIPNPPGRYIDHPTFTPDGKHILFLAASNRGDGDVMTMGVDGSGLKRITSTK